jgi:hypothetical protein
MNVIAVCFRSYNGHESRVAAWEAQRSGGAKYVAF